MLAKILPVILFLAGAGAGIGAGVFTAPASGEKSENPSKSTHEKASEKVEESGAVTEFVKLNNQFVVPLVSQDRVTSMVVVSLSLEVESGTASIVYEREPKLRDLFLRVLFDHANMGGFTGSFTDSSTLDLLRGSLREAAQKELGAELKSVLITDIARQDT